MLRRKSDVTPQKSEPKRIVVLTREHIGDLICTTPALRSLRRLFPNAHITVEVGERAACVLMRNPNIDAIMIRPDHHGLVGKIQFVMWLRRNQFDLGVILDNSADMVFHLWLGKVPQRVGIKYKERFSNLFTKWIPFDRTAHEMIDNFRNVVALIGGDVSDQTTEIFPSDDDRRFVERILCEHQISRDDLLVALNPGASLPSNRWPPKRFAELILQLSMKTSARLLLLGGPGDLELANAIDQEIDLRIGSLNKSSVAQRPKSLHIRPVRLTGLLTIHQLAAVISQCRVMVTGDTGPMHIAAAVGTPVVAVFGPAAPHESGPNYVEGNCIIRKVESCQGCTKKVCVRTNQCMFAITAEEVANKVIELLDQPLARQLAQTCS